MSGGSTSESEVSLDNYFHRQQSFISISFHAGSSGCLFSFFFYGRFSESCRRFSPNVGCTETLHRNDLNLYKPVLYNDSYVICLAIKHQHTKKA